MNLATQYQGQSFALVNRLSFETLPVRVPEHAVRAVAKRVPDIACQISEIRESYRDDFEKEP
jgi:hypothetical protein